MALDQITKIDIEVESYLGMIGQIVRAFRDQDSGCVSFAVEERERRWLVKHSSEPRGVASLERARNLNQAFQHHALPRLHNCIDTPGGKALVYEWVPGELLSHSQNPGADERFRRLRVDEILRAIDTLFDLHLKLAERGYIAVDLYDGCFLYDFDQQRFWMCDLDEYRPHPFVLEEDRLPGSTRFMAPEEFVRGAMIDQVTNVFSLGRAAMVLLGDRQGTPESFRGNRALRDVALKSTSIDRAQRYRSVSEFVMAWNAAADVTLSR